MQAVQDSSINSLLAPSDAGSVGAKKEINETQDRFLKLLVAQMKNQDPLNPLDNAEVTSQLAQISTVNGIDKLNETMKLLLSDFDASRSLEATAMIGRNVLVPGTSMQLDSGKAIAGIELPQPVDRLVVTIKDNAGIAIRELDLGAQAAGIKDFAWDGITDSGSSAADGNYSFSVSAHQGDKDIVANALALGHVNSIESGNKGVVLDLGKLGITNLSAIKQIF
jgi:flagellar basal-body rod modification protein FlgD